MGQPKGLIRLRDLPLIRLHIDAFHCFCSQRTVVLGARAAEHLDHIPTGVRVVFNRNWHNTWPADSLHLALRGRPLPERAWVTPVDVPPPSPTVLQAMLAESGDVVPCDPAGQSGHPALVTRHVLKQVLRHPPIGGLRTLLTKATRVATPDPVAANLNHREALESFLSRRDGQGNGA